MRTIDVEQVQQQQVGALAGRQFGVGDVIEQRLSDRDGFADQDAPFAGADGIEQIGFANIGQIAGAAVQIAFHETSSGDVSGKGWMPPLPPQ